MGMYVNAGNQAFAQILKGEYVDKTGLISLINERIEGPHNLVCVSRPRRFGKTYVAKMLAAYYDRSCDSDGLFSDRTVAGSKDYKNYLNKYNVISLDITGFISQVNSSGGKLSEIPRMIEEAIKNDLMELGIKDDPGDDLNKYMLKYTESEDGRKFVFIIDEWDALIREASNEPETLKAYFNLLRGWFKNNNFTPKVVAFAYMTGILPIKKDGTESAISDFDEFSIIEPGEFAAFYGFTEDEVRSSCDSCGSSFEGMKEWYDGYCIGNTFIYNPYSVMCALRSGKFGSYWKKTSAAETLITYIDIDIDGLQDAVARITAGERVSINTGSFQNDVETFFGKDDVLTLMVHLGYLTYEADPDGDGSAGDVWIPNEEVKKEFENIIRKAKHKGLVNLIKRSDKLLEDTIAGNSDAVAKAIQEVHDTSYAPVFYNNEQSLRAVVKMAYISCVDQYARVEELPSGHGICDVVFLPKKRSPLPPMVIELKWNKSAEGAIRQIKDGNYESIPKELVGEVILVGVSYDEGTKEHSCVIEKHYASPA